MQNPRNIDSIALSNQVYLCGARKLFHHLTEINTLAKIFET
jgi:hypothetical protein